MRITGGTLLTGRYFVFCRCPCSNIVKHFVNVNVILVFAHKTSLFCMYQNSDFMRYSCFLGGNFQWDQEKMQA